MHTAIMMRLLPKRPKMKVNLQDKSLSFKSLNSWESFRTSTTPPSHMPYITVGVWVCVPVSEADARNLHRAREFAYSVRGRVNSAMWTQAAAH